MYVHILITTSHLILWEMFLPRSISHSFRVVYVSDHLSPNCLLMSEAPMLACSHGLKGTKR